MEPYTFTAGGPGWLKLDTDAAGNPRLTSEDGYVILNAADALARELLRVVEERDRLRRWMLDAEAAWEGDRQRIAALEAENEQLRREDSPGDWTLEENEGRTAERRCCNERLGNFLCTRPPDHMGDHAAGTGERIAARWPQEPNQ